MESSEYPKASQLENHSRGENKYAGPKQDGEERCAPISTKGQEGLCGWNKGRGRGRAVGGLHRL